MTGIAATPNKNFPAQVSLVWIWNTLVFFKNTNFEMEIFETQIEITLNYIEW